MKIKGKAMWASVQTPNTTFEPTYQIDLIIEDNQVKGAEGAGLKVKKRDGENIVTFRRPVTRSTGEENKPPVVVDAERKPFTDLIGNGSVVYVQFNTYTYKNKFGSGTGSDLQGVQVLELVRYAGQDGDEFEVEADNEFENEEAEASETAKSSVAEDFDDDLPDML